MIDNHSDSSASSSQTDSTPQTDAAPPANPAWDSLGLSEAALAEIRKAGFQSPTPVQAQAIPIALEGFDVIASAQTGTGKTASFALPMIERIAGREGTYGLILAPTREIVLQIHQTVKLLGEARGVRSITLIGGIDMKIDAAALNSYPQIIVATPGRLVDHIERGNVWLSYIEMVVLDEADRMLDMGFSDQLNRIMAEVPENRQTMLFSATIPPNVEKLSQKILYQPKRVSIGRPLSTANTVEQRLLFMREEDKNRELRRLIQNEKGTIIVFTRSKDGASRVWRSLHSYGIYDATYIHSDRLQAHREQALEEFKSGKYRVLIATDVAGRGIHVDAIAHVVNYDLPREPEDYVHRIGRTGRQEATGIATSFVTYKDKETLRRIEKLIGKRIEVQGDPANDPRNHPEFEGSLPDQGADRGGRGSDRGGRGGRGGRSGRGGEGRGRGPSDSQPREAREPREARPPRAPQNSAPIQAFPSGPAPEGDSFYQPAGGAPDGLSPSPQQTREARPPRGDQPGQDDPNRPRRRRRRGGRGRGPRGDQSQAPGGTPPSGGTSEN